MVKLKNQSRAAQNQLRTIAYTWEEYQKLRTALGQAQANESIVSSLAERVRTQVVQVLAELAELQRVAASSNAEELSERLRTLRLRTEELIGELDTAKTHYIRSADERAANLTSSLMEVEENLRTCPAGAPRNKATSLTNLLPIPSSSSYKHNRQSLKERVFAQPKLFEQYR